MIKSTFYLGALLLLTLSLQSGVTAFEPFWAAPAIDASVECPTAPATPGDRRTDKSTLRVISYNVEWLFEGDDGKSPRTPEDAKRHVKALAKVLAELRPDILVMQEVQNCEMVRRLAAELDNLGHPGYEAYLVKGTDTGTMQNVALMTLVDPVVDLRRTADRAPYPIPGNNCDYTGGGGDYGVSKHMVTRFKVGSQSISLVSFHFLAFPTWKERCAQREAQASVIRRLVDEELKAGHEVVLLGDMNDYSDKLPDVDNNVPNSRVMKILRDGLIRQSLNDPTASASMDVTRTKMNEVSQRISQRDRFSAVYNTDSLSQIDHFLLSPGLWSSAKHVEIYHGYAPYEVSDHWPVIVDIRVPTSTEEDNTEVYY